MQNPKPRCIPKSKGLDAWAKTAKPHETYRMIGLPDIQCPYHDEESLAAVEKYMAEEYWHEYLNFGDFMDFDCISSHNKNNLRQVEGKDLFGDYIIGNDILDRHQAIVRKNNKNASFTMLEGNHDYRVERYIEEFPQLRGSIEVEKGLELKERGFTWVRCYAKGEVYKVGKAYFHHGLYCSGMHAKKMVENFGVNIFYGHTHDVMQYSKVLWGKDRTIVGQSLGCLCDYEQSYIGSNPTNWQQAFAVFYFRPDGNFSYYVPRIINHEFVAPNGKVYRP